MPDTFRKAKMNYIRENDPVQQFIEEFCEISPDYRVIVTGFQSKLRKEYGLESEYSSQSISKIMSEKGFEKSRRRSIYNGTRFHTKCYIGIRIKPSEDEF